MSYDPSRPPTNRRFDDLVDSQRLIEVMFQGLPIKWVVYTCNQCIRGVDFQGSNKSDCIRALSKWHIIGRYSLSSVVEGQNMQERWDIIRRKVALAHRSYATWLRHRSEKFDARADRILEILRKEEAK